MREHTNAQDCQILLKFQYIKAGGKYSNQWPLRDYSFRSNYLQNVNNGRGLIQTEEMTKESQ
jgi:hypothetical protein